MGYYTDNVNKEHQRQCVERLLESELSVPEWCRRNGVLKSTMYRWLTIFAEHEPELFGGRRNIVDRSKRRWVETTRANIRASRALATTAATSATPATPIAPKEGKRQAPGVIIVDTLYAEPAKADGQQMISTGAADPILIELNGASVVIPSGCAGADITSVLRAVALL